MGGHVREWGRGRSKRQCSGNNDEAHSLVEDHGFKCLETEDADEQRESELSSAEANQASQSADDSAATESGCLILRHHHVLWSRRPR